MRRTRLNPDSPNSIASNPKALARYLINQEIRAGRVIRPDVCSQCGEPPVPSDSKINAHHDDYTQALNVRWLCVLCHNRWHLANDNRKWRTK